MVLGARPKMWKCENDDGLLEEGTGGLEDAIEDSEQADDDDDIMEGFPEISLYRKQQKQMGE